MSTQEHKKLLTKEVLNTSSNFSKKTLQDYEVISVIGNGAFGTCFKVRDKESGKMYAWKGMDYDELSEYQKESLVSEIRVLRQLQHPNIVQYYHHLVNYEAKSIFIVMECCEGGDLAQLIAKAKVENKRFEERYVWRVLFQVCRALQVCHNKIKEGTILHRDIKPANIFLDTGGNAKLGDFGLARILRSNESFAKTFVGTPYYMSPEIIKGSKYDRKSDVWAVGCLTYEMCSLQPPFKGKQFCQLSANISLGKFSNIPDIYSKDLRDIISFMLEVENDQRPSIEVITRHPLVVRNIDDLGNDFPILVDIELRHQDFYVESRRNLDRGSGMHDFSSTMISEQKSFNETYRQKSLSISGIFTPDLKDELFYSAKRKIFSHNSKIQLSDPEIYESIRHADYVTIDDTFKVSIFEQDHKIKEKPQHEKLSQNDEVMQYVFNDILKERLHAIRAQESLLKQREEILHARELQLNEKEKRLIVFEQNLVLKCDLYKKEPSKKINCIKNITNNKLYMPNVKKLPAPMPPRKSTEHDDSYCTIEPSDSTLLHEPTMAKLNIAALPPVKAFPRLRKVTFQSPKKFFTYNMEEKEKKVPMLSSTSSKSSEDSSASKRKSIFSIFSLSRSNKESTNSSAASSLSSSASSFKAPLKTTTKIIKKQNDQRKSVTEEPIISKCESSDLPNIWTKEHKKAAFEMLAAINAAERSNDKIFSNAPRHKIRQSARERNTLQRNRLRRSVILPASLPTTHQRESIIV